MGVSNRKNGICPECGGFRVTKEQLGGGRQSSYDDAIEAARMNDETRLNGIFSLKSTAVSNNSSGANLDSDPFTAPTVKKQKVQQILPLEEVIEDKQPCMLRL